jgi:hypothetical protein
VNRKVVIIAGILAVVAIVVVGLLVMSQGAKGGNDGNGVVTPSPTVTTTPPTATPNTPTPAPPPASPTPVDEPTPVPVATIVIRALENPYRFEPNIVTLKAGSTYTLQLIGGEENHAFVVNNADLRFYESLPAHTVVLKVFTAPDAEDRYLFEDPDYKKYDMVGVFVVTKD